MTAPSDPRLRLALGLAGLAAAALAVETDGVGPVEARVFRSVNRLPDFLAGPVWLVMQSGTLAAAPAAALLARAADRPLLARRLLVGGASTWALSKAVKRCVRRPRPDALLAGTRRRGAAQTGLGFVSGHAGVAAAMGAAVAPELGPGPRQAALAVAAAVGLARLYVGAHLPLDVVGGVALGVAVDAVIDIHDRRQSALRPNAAAEKVQLRLRRPQCDAPAGAGASSASDR